jgi:dihydrolipoamide dehydrogenase
MRLVGAELSRNFDLAVIGSGPGGYRAAVLGALRGLRVAIVEAGEWGGCCLNRGCVPKKAWYAAAQVVAGRDRYTRMGLVGNLGADLGPAWQHQRRIVEQIRTSYLDYLTRLGVVALRGQATFVDAQTLSIAGAERIKAGHVIVATGATPHVPTQLRGNEGRVLTTDDLFQTPPPAGRKIAVIGSGAVATELAFILTMLGCEVRWVARRMPLVQREYSIAALRALDTALKRHGVRPRLCSSVRASADSGGSLSLQLDDGASEAVDWLVLGTGRVPHTAGLGLENAGVALDNEGYIAVDEYCATSAPSVFAIGDVVNRRMSANRALADAAIAIENILTPGAATRNPDRVPEVIYSAVELARIGKSEEQAEAEGLEPAVGFAAFEVNPAALGEQDTDGYVRLVAELDRGELLGAEIVGRHAGDLIQIVEQALGNAEALRVLARLRYNHPARGEEILNAVQTLAANWALSRFVY